MIHSAGFTIEASMDTLQKIHHKYKDTKGTTIPILFDIQGAFGYLPDEAINWIADKLNKPRSKFFGVATFYSQFSLVPRGKNIFTVCCGTACQVKGSDKIYNALRKELALKDGQDTTDDLGFTVEKVNCVGTCSIAPVVIENKNVTGKTSSIKILKRVKQLIKEESK